MILTSALPSKTKERKNGSQKTTNVHCTNLKSVALKKVLTVNHMIQRD